MIVEYAPTFFAEHGLEASTSDLAKGLGITQPLLYRYFPTKDALIHRVYVKLRATMYDPQWEALLSDDRIPLADRLVNFYLDYSRRTLTFSATRLALYVRAHNLANERHYYGLLGKKIFPLIVKGLRAEYGGPGPEVSPTVEEMEVVQTLHGAIVHLAQRRWAHRPTSVKGDVDRWIRLKVRLFLDGAREVYPRLGAPPA